MTRFRADRDSPVTDRDLSAFADGQLSPARARRVAEHLRTHPEDADRVHAYWHQEAQLRRAFAHLPDEHSRPRRVPDARQRRRASRAGSGRRHAACAALLVLAVVAVRNWPDEVRGDAPTFATTALEAYLQSRPAEPDNGVALEFASIDLEPVQRRRIPLEGGEMAEHRYRRPDGTRVALYTVPAPAGSDDGLFRVFQRSSTRVVEWTAADTRYALVGKASASELTRLAVELRRNLVASPSTIAEVPRVDTRPSESAPVGAAGGASMEVVP